VTGSPSVGVVIPTHRRPELLAEALRAVLEQEYDGRLEVLVVHDRSTPDTSLEQAGSRPVRVLANERTPGLSGTRNTGILALDTDLVAFCDDDDVWLPGKLSAQVAALRRHTGAPFATCAIEVAYRDRNTVRRAQRSQVFHEDLLRSRMSMLHSSTFLMRRDFVEAIGLVSEAAPQSQNEDWDLLLRATDYGPLAHVDEPLVRVRWNANSYYQAQWETRAESLRWMLERHPDIAESPVGSARAYGQLAFADAALGRRREASRWAGRALRRHATEWRAVAALAVASGVVRPERVQTVLHRFGRGV